MKFPSLETVGKDFNASGAKGLDVPKLKTIGGNFFLEGTGLSALPPSLEHIGGDVYISSAEPQSLADDLIKAKATGILKGNIYLNGLPYHGGPVKLI